MTRTISRMAVAAFAVMAIASPTAIAGGLPGAANVDAHQRAVSRGADQTPTYSDAFERAVAQLRSNGAAALVGDSHNRFDLPSVSVSAPTVSSDRVIEWLQVGIGFSVGILLAVGLWLIVGTRNIRPLAH